MRTRAANNAQRMFAYDEALKFLEQARESAEALHGEAGLDAIDEQIGDIQEVRGTIRPAVESYERVLARVSAPETRAALKAKLGNAYVPIGDPRGLAYLEEAIDELNPQTQTNILALATALVGRYYHYRTEHRKAIEFLERARQLAEPLDNPATLAVIYSFLAGANQHLLKYAESDDWARKSIAYGERKNFPHAIANGYEFLGENAAGRGYWDEALEYSGRDREFGAKSGSLARVAWAEFAGVQCLHGRGELVAAQATAQAALAVCDQIGEARLATWLVPTLAMVTADLGDDGGARKRAEDALVRSRNLGQLVLSAWALHAAGYAAIQRDDAAAAIECYGQYLALVQDTENGIVKTLILASAARAFARGGRLDEAAALADKAVAITEFAKAAHYAAIARSVQGEIFAARGKHDDALQAYDAAIAALGKAGSRLELNRALYQRAKLQLAHGDAAAKDSAHADAIRVRDEFADMGAVHDRERAEQLLRA